MGPRSEDRGYRAVDATESMVAVSASMGPRSEDRGYRRSKAFLPDQSRSFNGSTVRGPWLSMTTAAWARLLLLLQWVHGPRTVVIAWRSEEHTSELQSLRH